MFTALIQYRVSCS